MALQLNKNIFIVLPAIFLASCSSKQYFVPEESKVEKNQQLHFLYNHININYLGYDEVFLSNGSKFDKNGLEINSSLKNIDKRIEDAIVWSEKNNQIAYLTSENIIALFDKKSGKTIFKKRLEEVQSFDRRVPKPVFDGENILYFSLDGKIIVISKNGEKILRTFSIGSGRDYSNIIDYSLTQDHFIAVSHREIVSISDIGEFREELNIRGAIFNKNSSIFYIVTKDGEIIKYNSKLVIQDRIKFPFARFISFGIHDNKIILIESNGYIIEIDVNLKNYRVFNSELDSENCFFAKDKFICDEKILKLPL
jgi:hypothetical protein